MIFLKLLKYDILENLKAILSIFLMIIVMACVNNYFMTPAFDSLFDSNNFYIKNIIFMFSLMIYAFFVFIALFMSFMLVIKSYYYNLYGENGYFYNAIPTSSLMHISARVCTAVIWLLLSIGIILLSIVILAINGDEANGFVAILDEINQTRLDILASAENGGWLTAKMIIWFVLVWIKNILLIFAAIGIGQIFGSYRSLFTLLSYIAVFIISNLVNTLIYFAAGKLSNLPEQLSTAPFEYLGGFATLGIIVNIVLVAALFFLNSYLLKNKLNLE